MRGVPNSGGQFEQRLIYGVGSLERCHVTRLVEHGQADQVRQHLGDPAGVAGWGQPVVLARQDDRGNGEAGQRVVELQLGESYADIRADIRRAGDELPLEVRDLRRSRGSAEGYVADGGSAQWGGEPGEAPGCRDSRARRSSC